MQFFKRKITEPYISEIAAEDIAHVATIHSDSFVRGWSKTEIAKMLGADHTFGLVLRREGNLSAPPLGFVLVREVADEAEVLSIATDKSERQLGVGRFLMDAVLRRLQADRVKSLFLEVDENNDHAIALYRKIGFKTAGKREGYYRASPNLPNQKPAAALVMRLQFEG